MVRSNYKQSVYMALKQAAKIAVEDGSMWWPEALRSAAKTTEVEELAEALVLDVLISPSFSNEQERSIGLLFAAEYARAEGVNA